MGISKKVSLIILGTTITSRYW